MSCAHVVLYGLLSIKPVFEFIVNLMIPALGLYHRKVPMGVVEIPMILLMWRNNQGDLQLSHNYYVVFLSVSRVKTTITKIGARRRFRPATTEKKEWSPLMLHCSD
ncbi:hypothetical protein RHGRI_026347 [Rhododendron griersonianum]|uniref:Uncharacterized protein n=1 Tax=Rhododendron griersonianum TaxID=479676 RepID=A0AAV6ITW4_9ERIC|nr:hypothetical protein RHGRI_026347 [Rhododendron griersonianum]KAG5531694.1 hypothetical protein RHGRI_026347 [Rhododendron griersonianum]